MKLHTLEFQAIGPFPGKHRIDFDALAASGLFMLEGPTGSGKSTIIDAIVFALYGQPAHKSAISRMRSDHADPATESFVELTFSTDVGYFRIRRTPEFQRPKVRGTGTTTAKSTVSLVKVASPQAPAGEPISARAPEVGAEIERLVGLNREQFTQVVVLPQGKFAEFLRASVDDRRKVLQRLFGTEIFQRTEAVLIEQAREASQRREGIQREVTDQLHLLAGTADLGDEQTAALVGLAGGSDAAPLRDAVNEMRQGLATRAASLAQKAEEAKAASLSADNRLKAEESLAERLRRRAELLEQSAELEARREEVDASRERHDLAQRAARVHAALVGVAKAEPAVGSAQAALSQAVDQVSQGVDADLVEDLDTLADLKQQAADARAGLESAEQREAALPRLREALDSRREELRTLGTQIEGADERLREFDAETETVAQQRAQAHEVAATRDQAQAARDEASTILQTATKATELRDESARAEAAVTAAAEAEHEAQEAFNTLRAAWVEGLATRLAGSLTAGDRCPVCGAVEHPAPAQPRADVDEISDEDLDAAETTAKQRRDALSRTKERWEAARQSVESLGTEIPEVAAAQQAVDRATQTLTQVREAEKRVASLTLTLEKRTAERAAVLQQIAEQQARLAALKATIAQSESAIAAEEKAVAEARGDFSSVTERREALRDRVHAADTLLGARDTLARAEAQRAQAKDLLATTMAEEHFSSAEDAQAAALPPSELAALGQTIKAFDEQAHHVATTLASPELASLTGEETPDVDVARLAVEGADAARETAVADAQAATTAATRTAAIAQTFDDRLTDREQLDAESGPLTRMAEIAAGRGANSERLTLSTFVLVRRFEQVLAAANARLRTMTSGRYEMVRSDGREKGTSGLKTGLGIDVVDHHTDKARAPISLSGGETFQFSLCLALGLADVVSEENGAISMGTLFVDEGFGSLDQETLTTVMAELTALHQEGNRAVGVVSHVSEMKSMIADRIEVRRGRRGSTLEVIA